MKSLLFTNYNTLIIVFIVSLLLCLIGSGSYPIYILDEAKNTEAAREMLNSLNFIVPTFNGSLRTDKPVLHYYFMMLGYKIFGINAFGARFFSGVMGALTITSTFFFVKKNNNLHTAIITVVLLWSSVFFIQEFHLAVPDPYLIFFISIGLWLFYDFHTTKNKKSLRLCYIAFGLGFLTKGAIAIALPGLICLLFLIFTKKLNIEHLKTLKMWEAVLVVLIINAPWYILVHIKTNGAFTEGFFLNHNFNRFGSKMEGHGGPFIITWLFVLLGLLPFSFFTLYALANAFKNKKDSSLLFSSLTSVVFIIFFSISGTKLPNYTMPCYPFLAYLISKTLNNFIEKPQKNLHVNCVISLMVLIGIALPIGGKIVLLNERELVHISNISFWLLPTCFASIIGGYFYFKNRFEHAFFTLSGGWILLIPILFLIIYPKLTLESPVEKTKAILVEKNIASYKRFDAAFPFNLKQTFEVFKNESEVQNFFKENPESYLITNEKKVFELLNKPDLELIFEGKALFESHTTRVFKLK